jgi:hypothetical protein
MPSQHRTFAFPTRRAAEHAAAELIAAGFDPDHVSLCVHTAPPHQRSVPADHGVDETIEASGTTGAELGAVTGGAGGLLSGLGLLTIPGVGSLLGVGPLAAAFTGAITGGAIAGFAGALIGLGISKAEALAAERHLKAGRALLVIDCGARCDDAAAVVGRAGGSACEP